MSSPYELVVHVLPQALRLARYQASTTPSHKVVDLVSENETINQTHSREEERLLVQNANVVMALEDLFSWSEKDRTSQMSRLSRVESMRLQRAMYRLWLLALLCKPGQSVPKADTSAGEQVPDVETELRRSWDDQKSFLAHFSTQEVFQMDRIRSFLSWTAQWAVTAEENSSKGDINLEWFKVIGMLVCAGPHAVLRCYEDATTTHLPKEYIDIGPYMFFIDQAVSEIAEERKVTVPSGYGFSGFILDDLHGEHDRCHHCGSDGKGYLFVSNMRILPRLYNQTNWEHLKGRLRRDRFMLGRLAFDPVEVEPLIQALGGNWSQLLHDMFDSRRGTYAKWSKHDWICVKCWGNFLEDTIWRLSQKKTVRERKIEPVQVQPTCGIV